jgi:large subunit ribosomal protein L10
VKAQVEKTPSFIVIDPSKLTSGDTLKLRTALRGVGAKIKVAKVGILARAVPSDAAKLIEGKTSIGLVLSNDVVGAAKVVQDVFKDEKEPKLTVKGAFMDGLVYDAASVKRFADLPSKQTLRGMFVNVLAAPLVGLARVIAEIEKKQKGGAA